MAKYSESNIVDSDARFLCFASSTILRPSDIHGDQEVAPMASMSALARALYEFDNKIATVLAGQFQRAKLVHMQSRLMPFIFVQLSDGRLVSPFIVRRHTMDQVDNRLTIQSAQAMFRRILAEALSDQVSTYAIERPVNADKIYDRIVAMLPDNVTIHKEVRDEDT